jgi:hypothetical protein
MQERQKAIEWYVFILAFLLQPVLGFIFMDVFLAPNGIISQQVCIGLFAVIFMVDYLLIATLWQKNKGYCGPKNLLRMIRLEPEKLKYEKMKFDHLVSTLHTDVGAVQRSLYDLLVQFFASILFFSLFLILISLIAFSGIDELIGLLILLVSCFFLIMLISKLLKIRIVREMITVYYLLLQESGIFLRFIYVYALLFIVGFPVLVPFISTSFLSISTFPLMAFFQLLFFLAISSVFIELLIYLEMKFSKIGLALSLLIFVLAYILRSDPFLFMGMLVLGEGLVSIMKYSISKNFAMTTFVSLVFILGIYFQNPIILIIGSVILLPVSYAYMWFKRYEMDVLLA